jgi:hypothetical protein
MTGITNFDNTICNCDFQELYSLGIMSTILDIIPYHTGTNHDKIWCQNVAQDCQNDELKMFCNRAILCLTYNIEKREKFTEKVSVGPPSDNFIKLFLFVSNVDAE